MGFIKEFPEEDYNRSLEVIAKEHFQRLLPAKEAEQLNRLFAAARHYASYVLASEYTERL